LLDGGPKIRLDASLNSILEASAQEQSSLGNKEDCITDRSSSQFRERAFIDGLSRSSGVRRLVDHHGWASADKILHLGAPIAVPKLDEVSLAFGQTEQARLGGAEYEETVG
jgi:hypothetical protein